MNDEHARLVVVEDDVEAAAALAGLLELEGFEVRVAHDGAQALAAIAEFDPLAVLLDLGLPDIDGIELARRLRSQYGSTLVLVAATGREGVQNNLDVAAAGIDHVLVKPIEVASLRRLFSADSAERDPPAE
jgi:DNA-binding response OmpR family regulator